MRARAAVYTRFLATFAVLGIAGVASTILILVNERVELPFQNLYTVRAEFSAADGVLGGVGEPVAVVGVKVGQVTGVRLQDGQAIVSMQLDTKRLAHVYADATVTLTPVTPLGDLEVDLNPGHAPAPLLARTGVIGAGNTSSPVPLSGLLASLDSDTRDYLGGLISGIDTGVHGRAPDLHRLLVALGPTAQQIGQISATLAQRRTLLPEFVHNLAQLTRAATRDGQLQSVVIAGQQTLGAIASQDRSLRSTLADLPSTLDAARSTLTQLIPFANTLRPTLDALLPVVRDLPRTLVNVGRFSARATDVLRTQARPLVREAQPLGRDAGVAVPALSQAAPALSGVGQTLNYLLNELAFVPGGNDQGYLFWMAWFMHNLDSATSTGDANGAVARADALLSCSDVSAVKQVQTLLADTLGICK